MNTSWALFFACVTTLAVYMPSFCTPLSLCCFPTLVLAESGTWKHSSPLQVHNRSSPRFSQPLVGWFLKVQLVPQQTRCWVYCQNITAEVDAVHTRAFAIFQTRDSYPLSDPLRPANLMFCLICLLFPTRCNITGACRCCPTCCNIFE